MKFDWQKIKSTVLWYMGHEMVVSLFFIIMLVLAYSIVAEV